MVSFDKYKSVHLLSKLSKNPIDLKKALTTSRVKQFKAKNIGFNFLFACERIDENIFNILLDLAKESKALDKIYDMQSGKKINFIENVESENTQILHTATRDFFGDSIGDKKARDKAFLEIEKLKEFLDKKNGFFENIIHIGIGGSILGVRSMYYALKGFSKKKKKVYFISNIDPDDLSRVLEEVDLSKTVVISVSKSGTTLETLTNEIFIREELKKNNLNPKNHIISVTSKNSKMDDKNRYLEVFYIWDYISGRFSSTSMVGGVTISLSLGFDIYFEVLKGANAMDRVAREKNMLNNLPLISALLSIWNRNFLKYQTNIISAYSKALWYLCFLVQQLEMESNGKSIDKKGKKVNFETGSIIWGDIGTDAQHSFFQFLHQGTDIAHIEFIGFLKSQYEKDLKIEETTSQEKLISNLIAQSIALAMGKKSDNLNKKFEGNRPSSILSCDRLTPFSFGALLSYYENKVTFEGFIWNINSFDQEGVQLGKVLSKKMLAFFAKKEKFELGEAFLKEMKD
ncbi:MAG: hypothetical protein AMS24_05280 [Chlamydiae bacterium SM23_39]|nr:MAG: hypothetical protein AMS24_05280 [Chlamydiae bacterium SM23_39]